MDPVTLAVVGGAVVAAAAFLEGCGYMARVAFIMDRIFRKFGLSGKSFMAPLPEEFKRVLGAERMGKL